MTSGEGRDTAEDILATVQRNDIYVFDLVAAQAQITPSSQAIATTCESLTYQELMRRTSYMSKTLQNAGL
ncbi:uncharacterized protein N7484_000364 [Penicillium longicatenatum]|uniref:uncharacterized protein n=1 Tax=Penicillium longicatenatum TaxID=1561947 RepID=UPI00254958AF|nr:uncharacterized protein N7484_000364 [Penicillium longicatenatum]KAJ5660992.1 hypothetical protein N7484_000364 [Penicillium longicatenatum]